MTDNYEVLYGKYQRAIISINELGQERDLYMQQAEELRDEHKAIEKNIETLCETILKKEREKQDAKKWSKMSTPELIAAAQDSLERYFPSIEEKMERLLKMSNERAQKIRTLEKEKERLKEEYTRQIESEREKHKAEIDVYKDAAKQGKIDQDKIDREISEKKKKITENAKKQKDDKADLLNGLDERESAKDGAVITVEDKDAIDKSVKNSVGVMYNRTGVEKDISGPTTYADRNAQKHIHKAAVEEAAKIQHEIDADVAKEADELNDQCKALLKVYGDMGFSEFQRAFAYYQNNTPEEERKAKTSMQSALKHLLEDRFMEQEKVTVPGNPHLIIQSLTEKGEDTYRYLYGKKPAVSERDQIVKNHSSLKHGYGIRQVAELIKSMKFVKDQGIEVKYLTRMKEYMVKVDDHSSYIPDIVLIKNVNSDNENRLRIEYETGDCTESDFIAKCNKISQCQSQIRFIVPDSSAKDITIKKAENWRAMAQEKHMVDQQSVQIVISSYSDLKTAMKKGQCDENLYWDKTIVVRKKGDSQTKKEG